MNATHIYEKERALVRKRDELICKYCAAARAGKSTARIEAQMRRINEFLRTLDRIIEENKRKPDDPRRYVVSSLFLHECAKKLTADRNEQFFFITGSEVEGVNVLDQWAEFAHERRTQMGVVADMPSTHNLLIRLEQFGHKFLAHFHSHPGRGPDATHPSGTDENFQGRLEKAGHLALMAIFSRDGYVRFMRMDQNFDLAIYGEGIEKHAPGIFRLKNLD